MTEVKHAVGNVVVLRGTIIEIEGDIALVRVDRSFPAGGTIAVKLGQVVPPRPSDRIRAETDRIREAMRLAEENPGRVVTVQPE